MNLLRATIADDRGRPARLLRLCMLAWWFQRGENRRKFEIQKSLRSSPKSWMSMVGVLGVVMPLYMVATVVVFRLRPPDSSSFAIMFVQAPVGPVAMWAVLLPTYVALLSRWAAPEIRDAYLGAGRCAGCFYELAGQQPDPEDECCVCPECGAAWRMDRPRSPPPPLLPRPVLADGRGHPARVTIPLRRRAVLSWEGATARDRIGLVAVVVLLLVLAPFFGRFAGWHLRQAAEAIFTDRWGGTFGRLLQMFLGVTAGLAVLAAVPLIWRSFWRKAMPGPATARRTLSGVRWGAGTRRRRSGRVRNVCVRRTLECGVRAECRASGRVTGASPQPFTAAR